MNDIENSIENTLKHKTFMFFECSVVIVQVWHLEFTTATRKMSSAFASSSKPSSSGVSSKKYDVFLSFRGEDTRNNFTSHLYDALRRNKVKTFIDNKELVKGDDISPAINKAIEEAHASIVIFSENYASSKWCLDELVKILECKKDRGQIVIPVFYNIDPSHVRKQTGSYEQAFAKHERDLTLNKDKLLKWKGALTETANLVGWDSRNRIESDLIKDIVKDVLRKRISRFKGPHEIEKNMELILSLLRIVSDDGGRILIRRLSNKRCFILLDDGGLQEDCYLANVGGESNKCGLNALRKKLFSLLLEEEDLRLVVLSMRICTPRSKLKKLWDGVQDLVNLEIIELWYSKDLIDVPDLSMALNLEAVSLMYCESLPELWLDDCTKLVSLPELPPSLKLVRAADCTSLDRDSTQRLLLVLENMLQSRPYVLGKFWFQTTEASATIPPMPKSDLSSFLFCTILSEGFNFYCQNFCCFVYEHNEQVDICVIGSQHSRIGTLISDHVLLFWYGCSRQESGCDHYNLSFECKRFFVGNGVGTEGIKGCGEFPVYVSRLGGSSSEQIVESETNAQIS